MTGRFLATQQRLLSDAGREYVLRTWRPATLSATQTTQATQALPTLLMLDGHWLSDTVAAALAALPAGELQIATLGYATNEHQTIAPWRAHDYTPQGPGGCRQDARTPQWSCGGADATLAFIRRDVLPLLVGEESGGKSGEDKAAPASIALFGHSYAGLFSLHCLLEAPELFCRIYAASPSLWWYWPHMVSRLAASRLADRDAPPVQLLVGGDERLRRQAAAPGQPREPGVSTLPYAREFVAALAEAGHAQVALHVFPGQAHGPMLTHAARHAVADFARSAA